MTANDVVPGSYIKYDNDIWYVYDKVQLGAGMIKLQLEKAGVKKWITFKSTDTVTVVPAP